VKTKSGLVGSANAIFYTVLCAQLNHIAKDFANRRKHQLRTQKQCVGLDITLHSDAPRTISVTL